MPRIRVHNLHGQVHSVSVKTAAGKLDTRFIPARGFIEVDPQEFTQDLYDKNRRGIVRFAAVKEPPKEPAKEPAKEPPKVVAKPPVKPPSSTPPFPPPIPPKPKSTFREGSAE